MFDLSIFTTAEAWISLLTLVFLEIVLGVDNIVFIVITTDRLPKNLQHIGRKVGLFGAMLMRILFLCFASYLVHITKTIFTIDLNFYTHAFSVRDFVLFLGGVYLIYKGIAEIRETIKHAGIKEDDFEDDDVEEGSEKKGKSRKRRKITLPEAVGTIMVMDIVFSIDSVITAVGLANHLIVMIIAVMVAVILMMVFIDAISEFVNAHVEMKILAMTFITVIGILLFLDGLGINSGIEVLDMHMEKLMVYFSMVFSLVIAFIQMSNTKHLEKNTCEIEQFSE